MEQFESRLTQMEETMKLQTELIKSLMEAVSSAIKASDVRNTVIEKKKFAPKPLFVKDFVADPTKWRDFIENYDDFVKDGQATEDSAKKCYVANKKIKKFVNEIFAKFEK